MNLRHTKNGAILGATLYVPKKYENWLAVYNVIAIIKGMLFRAHSV